MILGWELLLAYECLQALYGKLFHVNKIPEEDESGEMTFTLCQQARKPRSYASSKLCPLANLLTDRGKV